MTDLGALVAWYQSQLEDDEKTTSAATGGPWRADDMTIRGVSQGHDILVVRHTWPREADHIIRWDPDRALAEIRAKRTRLAWCVTALQVAEQFPEQAYYQGQAELAENVIKSDAEPYAARPGWRAQWAA